MIPSATISPTSSAATGSSPLPGCGADDGKQTTRTDEAGSWTRAGRKRRRDKQRARRQARTGGNAGGYGGAVAPGVLLGDWGPILSRGDMTEIGKAVRRDYPIPAAKRQAFCDLLSATVEHVHVDIPRHVLAATRLMLDMDFANIRANRRALRQPVELFPINGGNPS